MDWYPGAPYPRAGYLTPRCRRRRPLRLGWWGCPWATLPCGWDAEVVPRPYRTVPTVREAVVDGRPVLLVSDLGPGR